MFYYDSDQLRNKEFSPQELDAIIAEGNDITLSQLIHNPYLPDRVQDHLVRNVSLSRLEEWVEELYFFRRTGTRPEIEAVILQRCVATAIATDVPQYERHETEKCAAKRIEFDIADWSKTPSTLRLLAKHKTWQVRQGVVMNSNTPMEVWMGMCKDRSKDVREAVHERLRELSVIDLLGCVD